MAISGKYGRIDIPKIGDNEPVFILRANDQLAETVIEMYRLLAKSHNLAIADGVAAEVEKFRAWPGPKKLPD